MKKTPKVAFYTLGCKVNQYDTEILKELFIDEGYEFVDFNEHADVYVINTCVVTHVAERKSRQNARKAKKKNPESITAVVGCYPQVFPDKVEALEEIDYFIGTENKKELINLVKLGKRKRKRREPDIQVFEDLGVKNFEKRDRSRHFLKIQEGCERYCSYCIVPYARGDVRSRPIISIINETREAVLSGFKEIVLTGSNLGAFGSESFYKPDLADLIRTLTSINLDFRLRLSSIEPMEIDNKLLNELGKNLKICSHLHIPLQSGDDEILKRMNRPYNHKRFKGLISEIRKNRPDICLTTDVIVGFPGEEEKNFNRTKYFLQDVGFSGLHVFKYSKREGTPASNFDKQVSPEIKEKRSKELLALDTTLRISYQRKFLGKKLQALIEKEEGRYITALTGNYIKVYLRKEEIQKQNLRKLCYVKPYSFNDEKVLARLI